MKVLAIFLALIYCVHSQISGDVCTGTKIGNFTQSSHAITGVLFVEDEYSFCIANFTYDGRGPDVFLYFYYTGDEISETGGGVYIPIAANLGGPKLDNTAYIDGDGHYRFTIPTNQFRACDFEGFAIWCRYANALFARITWSTSDIFPTGGSGVQCTPSPGRGYVGTLPTFNHTLAGELYVKDKKTFVIRNFAYDGEGDATFVYVFDGVVAEGADDNARPSGDGSIIPLTTNSNEEDGSFDNTVYDGTGDDFVITIPADMDLYTCDVATFTIKSRVGAGYFFTRIAVDIELFTNNQAEGDYQTDLIVCDTPSSQPGDLVGALSTDNPRAISGTVYIVDFYTIFIQLFSYDAEEENVFIYTFPLNTKVKPDGNGGTIINRTATQDRLVSGRSNSYYNRDFTIDLRLSQGGIQNTSNIGYLAFIAPDTETILSQLKLNGAFPLSSTLTIFGASVIALIAMLFKP